MNNLIKGLDVGYAYTKDNSSNIFKSAYSYVDNSISGSNKFVLDDKTYYVGTGRMTSDVDKTDNELSKVCTLYNLAMTNVNECFLCVGLPIAAYKEQKEKLVENILDYNKTSIYLNGNSKQILIKDVCVAMQGVASLYTLEIVGECIVIDIGGLTIDIGLVDFGTNTRLLQQDTWYKGIRTLYSNIVSMVNNKFNLKLDVEYAEKILKHGLRIHGVDQDLSFVKPYLKEYLELIIDEIVLKYPTDTAPIYLTGGGAYLLENAFKSRLSDIHMIKDAQFANALGYYLIGCHKFKQVR